MVEPFPVQTPLAEQHTGGRVQIVRVTSEDELASIATELTDFGLKHVTNDQLPHVHEFHLPESLMCIFCDWLYNGRYATSCIPRFIPETCGNCGGHFRDNYALVQIWQGVHYRQRGKDESAPLGELGAEEPPPVPQRIRIYTQKEPLSDNQMLGAALGLTTG